MPDLADTTLNSSVYFGIIIEYNGATRLTFKLLHAMLSGRRKLTPHILVALSKPYRGTAPTIN
jgi:hypothetical protein